MTVPSGTTDKGRRPVSADPAVIVPVPVVVVWNATRS
jgi:hypothetical protein